MIDWRKWVDPILTADQEPEPALFPEMDDNSDDDEPSGFTFFSSTKPRTHPHLAPSHHWNIWVGHAREIITEDIAKCINVTPGVEAFEVNSPYRFHVAIARAFSEVDVKREIEKVFLSRSRIPVGLSELAGQRFAYHATLLMKDGTQEVVGGDTTTEVDQRVEYFIREKNVEEVSYSWQR